MFDNLHQTLQNNSSFDKTFITTNLWVLGLVMLISLPTSSPAAAAPATYPIYNGVGDSKPPGSDTQLMSDIPAPPAQSPIEYVRRDLPPGSNTQLISNINLIGPKHSKTR